MKQLLRISAGVAVVVGSALLMTFLSGCDVLPGLRDQIRNGAVDTVNGVKNGVENIGTQIQKTKDSVNQKVQDVQDAVKKVNDAVDAVKKVSQ